MSEAATANNVPSAGWVHKNAADILRDFNALLTETFITTPEELYMSYATYRWIVRGRIVAMLSRKRRHRPSFANALGRRG